MRPEALFINGIYESVLTDICAVQEHLPEHIMYLQPYSGSAIAHLREDPPSVDDPVRLLASVTDDLDHVRYEGQIVGWEYKTRLPKAKWKLLNRLVATLQPTESGLYDASQSEDKQSLNLLFVRRMRPIQPLRVTSLILISEGVPLAGGRTTAGGWAYVRDAGLEKLLRPVRGA